MKISKLLLLTIFLTASIALIAEPDFVIYIPSYNNEKYVIDNLRSACFQKYSKSYQVIYINDASTDKTGEIAEKFIRENHLEEKVTIVHNTERKGICGNLYNTIHTMIPDNKIVICLDGDDKLAHNNVLSYLDGIYSDPHIWLTYGSFVCFSERGRSHFVLPRSGIGSENIREIPFVATHLRTFKAGLFKKIRREDLLYDGEFYKMSVDMATMLPMIEMCSYKSERPHFKFIRKVLCHYRTNNPLSNFRLNEPFQKQMEAHVKNRPPYEPIQSLE